jgi:hypothetical protein
MLDGLKYLEVSILFLFLDPLSGLFSGKICDAGRWQFVELFFKFFDCLFKHLLVLSFAFLELSCPRRVVIVDKTNIVCWSFLCIFKPFVAFFHDFLLLQEKVPLNHRLKSFRGVFNVLQHSELDVSVPHDVRVCFVLLLPFFSALLILKARLIEINLFAHNNSLN